MKPTSPLDFHHRVKAVHHFVQLPESESLSIANKRVSNILLKQDLDDAHRKVNTVLLVEDAEKNLARSLDEKIKIVGPLFKNKDYRMGLEELASLKNDIDKFFDDVLVMTDDVELRDNRLALLVQLRNLYLEVADISCLYGS